jgi:hypothetical protein
VNRLGEQDEQLTQLPSQELQMLASPELQRVLATRLAIAGIKLQQQHIAEGFASDKEQQQLLQAAAVHSQQLLQVLGVPHLSLSDGFTGSTGPGMTDALLMYALFF